MKYIVLVLSCLFFLTVKSSDTLYVDDIKDPRLLAYKDSFQAYRISYAVAKNVADSVKRVIGSNSYDDYFLSRFTSDREVFSGDYVFEFTKGAPVEIGHVNKEIRGMKNEARFPWRYIETEYKKLDSIKIQPYGIMEGGELPNVYVWRAPSTTVIFKKIKRFTQVDYTIQFLNKGDGKTKTSYIRKFYYSEFDKGHVRIDSIEKLDPINHKHLFE